MTQAAGRAAATAVLAALAGAVAAVVLYAWHPIIAVEFDRDLPSNISGIYPPERDEAARLTFAWTGADASIRMPGLDRHVAWQVTMRVRGARVIASENPDLTVLADGLAIATEHTAAQFQDIRLTIPPRPQERGLVLELHASRTFVPGPSDPRALGVMIDRLTLAPGGAVLLPRAAIGAVTLTAAAMGAAIALLGVTAGSAVGGAVLLGIGDAAIVARGFGPFSTYPSVVLALGLWIAAALAGVALIFRMARSQPLRNTARFAVAFSAGALFLKLLVLFHPDMPIGDAMFHAHRFEAVLAGHFYFTSTAPGGYSFPYPPGLYVFAALFAHLVHRGMGDALLLRVVTLSVDAVAAALLYRAIAAGWNDRLAGAMAVALYHLVPLDFAVFTTGNLTNAFAQSLSVMSLVMMAAPSVRLGHARATIALAAILFAAFVSHTSTVAILFVSAVAIAAMFRLRGDRSLRSPAAAVAVAALVAGAAAIVIYYAHFMDTYRTEFARIGHETATAAPVVGHRTIGDRVRAIPYEVRLNFGLPLTALAAGGVWALRRRVDRLTLALAGWLLACVLFMLAGLVTPVDMRYYLAAVPAAAALAAAGGSAAWSRNLQWRVIALLLMAGAVVVGVQTWWGALG